jgi:hypothetical protein
MSMLMIIGCDHAVWGLGLWRCQVNLSEERGVVRIGEERFVQILGWRVVIVGIFVLGGDWRE